MPLRALCRGAYAPSPLGYVDNRLLPCGSGQDLRRFTLRQHDLDLSEPRTEEASVGESWRPATNVAAVPPAYPGQLGLLSQASGFSRR
jgi:hypothetical protein